MNVIDSMQKACQQSRMGVKTFFEKAGGEGSRGGKVIGHTKSGKPIYDSANHPNHSNFTAADHFDAYSVHNKKADVAEAAGNEDLERYHVRQKFAHFVEHQSQKEKENPEKSKKERLSKKEQASLNAYIEKHKDKKYEDDGTGQMRKKTKKELEEDWMNS